MNKLTHQFVEHIPEQLEEGVLYVSIKFATVAHLCCCGCGNETITKLAPIDWKMTFDGKSISLSPSIGNWNFDCKSHYWITHNEVHWAESWTTDKIARVQADDEAQRNEYYDEPEESNSSKIPIKKIADSSAFKRYLTKFQSWF